MVNGKRTRSRWFLSARNNGRDNSICSVFGKVPSTSSLSPERFPPSRKTKSERNCAYSVSIIDTRELSFEFSVSGNGGYARVSPEQGNRSVIVVKHIYASLAPEIFVEPTFWAHHPPSIPDDHCCGIRTDISLASPSPPFVLFVPRSKAECYETRNFNRDLIVISVGEVQNIHLYPPEKSNSFEMNVFLRDFLAARVVALVANLDCARQRLSLTSTS